MKLNENETLKSISSNLNQNYHISTKLVQDIVIINTNISILDSQSNDLSTQ